MIRNSFNPGSVLLESFRALGCERLKRLPPWRNMKNVDENTNGNSMRYCQRSRKRMKWDNEGCRYGSATLFHTAYGYCNTNLNTHPQHPSIIPHYPRLSPIIPKSYPPLSCCQLQDNGPILACKLMGEVSSVLDALKANLRAGISSTTLEQSRWPI